MNLDGTVVVYSASTDIGTGSHTTPSRPEILASIRASCLASLVPISILPARFLKVSWQFDF